MTPPPSETSRIQRLLAKSAFLRPIVERINAKEIFLFIVLLGILPATLDLSLFWLGAGAHLEFFIGDPTPLTKLVHLVPVVMLPLALFLIVRLRKAWYVVGLLPTLLTLVLMALDFAGIQERYAMSSWGLAIAYKVAFLFFTFQGHIRSPAFIFAVITGIWMVASHSLLMLSTVAMFVLMAVLSRFLYLAVLQNYKVFRGVKISTLAGHLGHSLLVWCPILLFSVPYYYVSSRLKKLAEDTIYTNTFVSRYNVYTEVTMDQLIGEFSSSDGARVKRILEDWEFPIGQHEQIQRNIRDALIHVNVQYIRPESFKDYRVPAQKFRETLTDLSGGKGQIDKSLAFMMEVVSTNVERIAIQRKFWGRNEVALDVQLSIYNLLSERQIKINEGLDERQKQLDLTLEKSPVLQLRDTIKDATNRMRNDTHLAVEARRSNAKRQIDEKLAAIRTSLQREIDTIPSAARKGFDEMAPQKLTDITPAFETVDAGLSIGVWAVNRVKELLQVAYSIQRRNTAGFVARKSDELRDSATRKLNESIANVDQAADNALDAVANDINQSANQASQQVTATVDNQAQNAQEALVELQANISKFNREAQAEINRGVETINEHTKGFVIAIHTYLKFAELLTTLSFVFVVVASFLYVFSRVAFSGGKQLFVTLREDGPQTGVGTLKKCGHLYSIPENHTQTFYVARRFEPTGRAPKLAIPQWPVAFFARLLNGAYFMDEISAHRKSSSSVDFRTVAGAEFVEWTLAEGEEVVFNYAQFVAMSDSVRLSVHISLRITSLLMGRPSFHIARGPGVLVLCTKGVPLTDDDLQITKSVSVDRIIAYQKGTQFIVDSELNIVDIYLSGLYLRRSSEGAVIIDADPGTSRAKVGLVRFLLKFLYPG